MRCIDCNFDLSHAGGQCPECGRAFDAADAGTFIGPAHSRVTRALAGAPGWPMSVGAAFVALLVLRADFSPSGTFGASIEAAAAALLFAVVFVGRALVALFAHEALPRRASPAGPQRVVAIAPLRWLLPIAVIGAGYLTAEMRVPRTVAFWLDRRVLEPVAMGPPVELGAWATVDAWSGRISRGIVRLDALVWAPAPDSPLDRLGDPSRGEMRRLALELRERAQTGHDVRGIADMRLPRLAVFLVEGTGYGGFTCAAWAYAPGAPGDFFLGGVSFHRQQGDWYRSDGWIDPRQLEEDPVGGTGVGANPETDGGRDGGHAER
jgi:hypothetical protein